MTFLCAEPVLGYVQDDFGNIVNIFIKLLDGENTVSLLPTGGEGTINMDDLAQRYYFQEEF